MLPELTNLAVDCKNFALYSGGISAFFRPLLASWIEAWPERRFLLVGPRFDTAFLPASGNWEHCPVPWPESLPRPLRHPVYDNLLFPRALRRLRPGFVFSPYHDVLLPRDVPSAMMVHDTCLADLSHVYPWRIRAYFNGMLRRNLRRGAAVLTVSETSRAAVLFRHGLEPGAISVICNAVDPVFLAPPEDFRILAIRESFKAGLLLFYAGGAEYRKNVRGLLSALAALAEGGHDPLLAVTGTIGEGLWRDGFARLPSSLRERVRFLGRIGMAEVRDFTAAADVVPYPTLGEGFGRLCVEAMAVGTPLACSDLPVLREVAGDYPVYFDPGDSAAIAAAILAARAKGRRTPRLERRFTPAEVTANFLETMDRLAS